MIDYKKELNDKQYEAVYYNAGPLLIIAGAGSGKTKTLTFKTAKLLEDGVNTENILLLTFTNRAANEMFSRINRLLGEDKGERITACKMCIRDRLLPLLNEPLLLQLILHIDILSKYQHNQSKPSHHLLR